MASSQAAAHRVALQGAEALAEAVAVAVVARVVPPGAFAIRNSQFAQFAQFAIAQFALYFEIYESCTRLSRTKLT